MESVVLRLFFPANVHSREVCKWKTFLTNWRLKGKRFQDLGVPWYILLCFKIFFGTPLPRKRGKNLLANRRSGKGSLSCSSRRKLTCGGVEALASHPQKQDAAAKTRSARGGGILLRRSPEPEWMDPRSIGLGPPHPPLLRRRAPAFRRRRGGCLASQTASRFPYLRKLRNRPYWPYPIIYDFLSL